MKSTSSARPMEYYLNLKYPMEIVEDDGAWVATIPDLPGCQSFGDSLEEAVSSLQRTKTLWIQGRYEGGGEIPEPDDESEYSGRFVLRIPKILHRSLAHEARNQGVSLNHYASHLLSQRQPFESVERFAQSIFHACSSWKTPWLYGHHVHDTTLVFGRPNANTDLLLYVRKPPARGSFKTPVEGSARQRYLPEPR